MIISIFYFLINFFILFLHLLIFRESQLCVPSMASIFTPFMFSIFYFLINFFIFFLHLLIFRESQLCTVHGKHFHTIYVNTPQLTNFIITIITFSSKQILMVIYRALITSYTFCIK